jgi:hypothetical protein
MRVNRVIVDAADHGIVADLTYTATTAAVEESRQTAYRGARLYMDATRATQWGTWTGDLEVAGQRIVLGSRRRARHEGQIVGIAIHARLDRRCAVRAAGGSVSVGADSLRRRVLSLPRLRRSRRHLLGSRRFRRPEVRNVGEDGVGPLRRASTIRSVGFRAPDAPRRPSSSLTRSMAGQTRCDSNRSRLFR